MQELARSIRKKASLLGISLTHLLEAFSTSRSAFHSIETIGVNNKSRNFRKLQLMDQFLSKTLEVRKDFCQEIPVNN